MHSATCNMGPVRIDVDAEGNPVPTPVQDPISGPYMVSSSRMAGTVPLIEPDESGGKAWQLEQEDMELDDDDTVGILPDNANHAFQALHVPQADGSLDAFSIAVGLRINNLGMDVWRSKFARTTSWHLLQTCTQLNLHLIN